MGRSVGRGRSGAGDRNISVNFVLIAGLILSYLMICSALLWLEIIDLAYYWTF